MSIIKGLFLGLKNQKVIPFNQMTPELHNQISSGLAKIMMAAKMTKAKLTKSQRDYIMNQAKQVQEFEDRYITGIKDKAGNIINKGKEKVADLFDLQGKKLDPKKNIMGGTQDITEDTGEGFIEFVKKTDPKGAAKLQKEENRIKAAIEAANKRAVKNLKDKKKKLDDPEDMAQGGRAGFKEGKIAGFLKSLKPFSSENKFSNQLEGILYGEIGLAEGLNLLSGSGGFGLFAEGGRIGYKDGPKDPRRRSFMKAAVGLASLLPFGLGKVGKVAAPVVAKAAEISGPALAKLVETVMSAGKFISLKGKRVKEMVTKKKLGKVEVEEDIADGSYIIKKDGKEIYYKPGRMDETGGIEDDIIEVIEDRVKKAGGGGIGYMLGE